MKRSIIVVLSLLCMLFSAQRGAAQVQVPARDTVVEKSPEIHPEYAGKGIFELLSHPEKGRGTVRILQSDRMAAAMAGHIAANEHKRIRGYRVRIFFDNRQTARNQSASIAASFRAAYPGIPVYENYSNPFFKVTVGDFRDQAEAQRFADKISTTYPAAFVVREGIRYPSH